MNIFRRYGGVYQPKGEDLSDPPTPVNIGGGSVGEPSGRAYGRLKRQLTEAQQKLVERDVEIAGLKTELAGLYDRLADLDKN